MVKYILFWSISLSFMNIAIASNITERKAPAPGPKAKQEYVIVDWPTGKWRLDVQPGLLKQIGVKPGDTISSEEAFELDELRRKQLR
jgi:hypothetical protein